MEISEFLTYLRSDLLDDLLNNSGLLDSCGNLLHDFSDHFISLVSVLVKLNYDKVT